MKIWYKNSDKTKVISFNKSVGASGEGSFDDVSPSEFDHDFYEINWSGVSPGDGTPSLARKAQNIINDILDTRSRVVTAYNQKHTDADNEISNSPFKGLTFTQVENWVDNNIADNNGTDLSGVRTAVKILGKGLLALWKKNDQSD